MVKLASFKCWISVKWYQ